MTSVKIFYPDYENPIQCYFSNLFEYPTRLMMEDDCMQNKTYSSSIINNASQLELYNFGYTLLVYQSKSLGQTL